MSAAFGRGFARTLGVFPSPVHVPTLDELLDEAFDDDAFVPELFYDDDDECGEFVTCQGCGHTAGMNMLGKAHACYRNEDGSMEEGGTYQ